MVVSASARNRLFNTLRSQLGDEDAATLMDSLPPGGWDDVATKTDLREVRSELKTEIADLRSELKTEIAELRAEMREGFARTVTRDELGGLLDLHLDARLARHQRSTISWMVAMNATMLTAVIAAIRL
jgi:hypothetical protein